MDSFSSLSQLLHKTNPIFLLLNKSLPLTVTTVAGTLRYAENYEAPEAC